jgi:hypothetical protein
MPLPVDREDLPSDFRVHALGAPCTHDQYLRRPQAFLEKAHVEPLSVCALAAPPRSSTQIPVTAGSAMELGIYTFGDITPDPTTGCVISTAQRYTEILAAANRDHADTAACAR